MPHRVSSVTVRAGDVPGRLVTDRNFMGKQIRNEIHDITEYRLQQTTKELTRQFLRYNDGNIPDSYDGTDWRKPIPALNTPASFAVCAASHVIVTLVVWRIRRRPLVATKRDLIERRRSPPQAQTGSATFCHCKQTASHGAVARSNRSDGSSANNTTEGRFGRIRRYGTVLVRYTSKFIVTDRSRS